MTGALGYHAGQGAEDIVARDYARRGHSVLERRWRGPGGEIDLILAQGAAIVFVEVKQSRSFASAAQALSPRQMRRIQASAADFLGRRPAGQDTEARFDVALVDGAGAIDIIENAFGIW